MRNPVSECFPKADFGTVVMLVSNVDSSLLWVSFFVLFCFCFCFVFCSVLFCFSQGWTLERPFRLLRAPGYLDPEASALKQFDWLSSRVQVLLRAREMIVNPTVIFFSMSLSKPTNRCATFPVIKNHRYMMMVIITTQQTITATAVRPRKKKKITTVKIINIIKER